MSGIENDLHNIEPDIVDRLRNCIGADYIYPDFIIRVILEIERLRAEVDELRSEKRHLMAEIGELDGYIKDAGRSTP